jgi:hypothetical protein
MALPNIFTKSITDGIIDRLHKLTPDTKALWGKMQVAQMLAHCNVTYEMVFEDKHAKPNAFLKFILKTLVKKKVVGDAPFEQNSRTAPLFIIQDEKNFSAEKERLIDYILKVQTLGESYFNNKESHSFGALSAIEWNNMFYKHLNHHLAQFGV